MFKAIHVARACLAVGAVSFLSQISTPALADNLCWRGWHAQAEKTAELGLNLLHSGNAANRVRLWRLLELGEDVPDGGRDRDWPSAWEGSWQDRKNAYDFLAMEAATRGVSWPLTEASRSGWRFNVWFAAKLFKERRDLLGDKHPYLKQWLENQQAVPAKSKTTLLDVSHQHEGLAAELAADDFQYQRAAQLFYRAEYDAAVDAFHAIAARPAPRHRSIAAYLVARSLAYAERYDEALAEIDAIQQNPNLADVHAIARQLLGIISWHGWSPDKRPPAIREAGRRLLLANAQTMRLPLARLQADPAARADYWQATYDLMFFLQSDGSRAWTRGQRQDDWWIDPAIHEGSSAWASALAFATAEDDMLDWLQSTEQVRWLAAGPWLAYWSDRTISSAFRAAADHVHQRAESSGSLAWAIADAMRSRGHNQVVREVLGNIDRKLADCTASRAALLARGPLRYHLARMEAIGQYGWRYWRSPRAGDIAWLEKLDSRTRVEATRFQLPLSGTSRSFQSSNANEDDLNRLLSRSLADFIAVPNRSETSDSPAAVINILPARILVQMAGDEALPEELRATLARNAWTRAYLLRDEAVLAAATELLPRLNLGLSGLVDDYRSAWTEAGRKRAALRLLLKAPTMQLMIPANRELAYYRRRIWSRDGVTAGSWSWFLSIAESSPDSVGLFWADEHNPNDGNWWCRVDIPRFQARLERDFYDRPLALTPDRWDIFSRDNPRAHISYNLAMQAELNQRRRDFLIDHPVLKLIDWEELGKLSKVPAAPDYLAGEVIAWVKDASWIDRWQHGDEMADALALSVRVTRFGCHRDGSNRAQSYAAYRLLHDLFPQSAAAAHTRYWYD